MTAPVDATSHLINLRTVSKEYAMGDNRIRALDDVSLTIARGEFVSVMGPSGSGKSTLMNIIGCLDTPSAGSYRLDGQDVGRLGRDELARIRNRTIGFVFQGFNLLARTSALENVALPLLYSGSRAEERYSRAREALATVGLADREHHHPNQLSGGQQQRVTIARAIVNQAPVILADEPTGNLDSATGIEIMNLFVRLNREAGITVIVVTHEREIAQYGRRLIKFRDGRIVSDAELAP
ncbi:MAG: ABC transporter ATP-binding protein [Deltaproteobacteria bacterium]|nr:ABC transporter ATP-binding protein [Deltaproteobacteria bacterium]